MKIALLLIFFIDIVHAVDWEARYEEVCSYDRAWCNRLKEGGAWVKPKKEILLLLSKLSPSIQKIATEVGVSPEAIVGSIVAENSMNVSISDGAQDFLVKYGLASKGKILGKNFTFGLGQLNLPVAMDAERYMANLEKRKIKAESEVAQELLNPEGAIYYVAGVLKHAQDTYKEYGFDISDKPEILATLYNLGKVEDRAKNSKSQNSLPRPNYFGLFVEKYKPELNSIIKESEVPSRAVASSTPLIFNDILSNRGLLKKNPESPSASVPLKATVLKNVFLKPMALYQAPPSCKKMNGTSGTEEKYKSLTSYPVTTITKEKQVFTEIAPSLDCEANVWKLVALDDGSKGWIKEQDLSENSGEELVTSNICNMKGINDCKEKVTAMTSALRPSKDGEDEGNVDNLLFVTPESIESQKPNFQLKADQYCSKTPPSVGTPVGMNGMNGYGGMNGYAGGVSGGGMNYAQAQNPYLKEEKSEEEMVILANNLKLLESNLKENIASINKMYPGDRSFSNPYKKVLLVFERRLELIEVCKKLAAKRDHFCTEAEIGKQTDPALITKIPRLETLFDLESESQMLKKINVGQFRSTYSEVEKLEFKEMRGRLNTCEKKLSPLKNGNQQVMRSDYLKKLKDIFEMSETEDFQRDKHSYLAGLKVCEYYLNLMTKSDEECKGEILMFRAGYEDDFKPSLIIKKIYEQSPESLDQQIYLDLSPIINTLQNKNSHIVIKNQYPDGYCGNQTADYIEDLVKENPCIKTVYVPDHWLVNRLNDALGIKVIYRPFINNDRYGIEFGDTQCKVVNK